MNALSSLVKEVKFTKHHQLIRKSLHIAFVFLCTIGFSQSNSDEEFQKLIEEIDELVLDYEEEPEEQDVDEEYYDYQTEQDKYLEKPIDKKSFDREKWERLRRDVIEERYLDEIDEDYVIDNKDNPYRGDKKKLLDRFRSYRSNRKNFKKAKTKPEEVKETPRVNPKLPKINPFTIPPWIGTFLFILLIAALVFLIFYLFFTSKSNEGNKNVAIDLEDIPPSEIPKTELQIRLEKALSNKDYRLAIRIYFIFLIKGLTEKNLITWEKEKTNYSYLVEMRNNKHYKAFDQAVLLYELIWYGKRKLSEEDYLKIEPQFKELVEKIEKGN